MELDLDQEIERKGSIFYGLTQEQMDELKNFLVLEKFKPSETIFIEESESSDMYYILEGEVEILKWDSDHLTSILIGTIKRGETFGEIAFLQSSKRSTTIKAIKYTKVYKLEPSKLSSSAMTEIRDVIHRNIALINNQRLVNQNSVLVHTLEETRTHAKKGLLDGRFISLEYQSMVLFLFLSLQFSSQYNWYLLWIIAFAPTMWLLKKFRISLFDTGLNIKDFKVSHLVASIAVLFVVIFCVLILNFFGFKQFSFPNLDWITTTPFGVSYLNIAFFAVFAFVHEWIARGVLQGSLKRLFVDLQGGRVVFLNSLFISILALFFSVNHALVLFFYSLAVGYLYLRQKNVYGISILHFLLLLFGLLRI